MAVVIKIPTWVTFNRIPDGTPPTGLAAINACVCGALSGLTVKMVSELPAPA